MMMAPETYYGQYLEGKAQEEVKEIIRDLKEEISRLVRNTEENAAGEEALIFPNTATRIKCCRDYLERAVRAYEETGGTAYPYNFEDLMELLEPEEEVNEDEQDQN